MQGENPEFDESPGVSSIGSRVKINNYEEERSIMHNTIPLTLTCITLKCRSVRIGSYKIYPEQHTDCIAVTLTDKGVSFLAPVLTDRNKCVLLTLKASETAQMWVSFSNRLPIIFAYTSNNFGEAVKKILDMSNAPTLLFDPTSDDERRNKLTFLIDDLNDEQRHFMRHVFPGQEKLKEIDDKEACDILVKSTPHNPFVTVFVDTKLTTVSDVPT